MSTKNKGKKPYRKPEMTKRETIGKITQAAVVPTTGTLPVVN